MTDTDAQILEQTITGQQEKLERDLRAFVGDGVFDGFMIACDVVYVARFVVRHPLQAARVTWRWSRNR